MIDAALVRSFVLGIAVAAPVGAMGVLCIQRVLAGGLRAGFATGLGIATADGAYAALAAFGVAAVTNAFVAWQAPLRLAGGCVLVWLGYRAMVSAPVHDAARANAASAGFAGLYGSAVLLTLTNPMTVMSFVAIFASAGLSTATVGDAAIATLGVVAGSLAWWVALSAGVAAARHAIGDRAVRVVNRFSGAVVAVFGLVAVVAGVRAYL